MTTLAASLLLLAWTVAIPAAVVAATLTGARVRARSPRPRLAASAGAPRTCERRGSDAPRRSAGRSRPCTGVRTLTREL